ncbi:hypothetical protein [Cysteiniphilum marinum]|uniref:hypothetical protein n=1 Tax=Cysteiniphilum marinum TaxID=2774191 RepID=UPI00193AD7D5|nr:hypothetical protein [Cysteiniphilum marinum]
MVTKKMPEKSFSVSRKWSDIRLHIKEINEEIFNLIDGKDYKPPIYEVFYKYGDIISDAENFYLPDENGYVKTLDALEIPFFLSIDKNLEIFLESSDRFIPDTIYYKGDFFPKIAGFSKEHLRTIPKSPYTWVAGLRNIIINPISQITRHYSNYVTTHNLGTQIDPDNPSEHFEILKSVTNNINTKWFYRAYIFPNEWREIIENDSRWTDFRIYLLQRENEVDRFRANTIFLDYALNEIILNQKITIKPYTLELIKQIISISLGFSPSLKPCLDDSGMPSYEFIKDYKNHYSSKSFSFIFEPSYLKTKDDILYFSISAANSFLVKKKTTIKPIIYLEEIDKSIDIILDGLSKHVLTKDSEYGMLKKHLKLGFYSSQGGKNRIQKVEIMYKKDHSFEKIRNVYHFDKDIPFNQRSIATQAIITIQNTLM